MGHEKRPSSVRTDPHPIRDFFIAELIDYAPKDHTDMMERPFFSGKVAEDRFWDCSVIWLGCRCPRDADMGGVVGRGGTPRLAIGENPRKSAGSASLYGDEFTANGAVRVRFDSDGARGHLVGRGAQRAGGAMPCHDRGPRVLPLRRLPCFGPQSWYLERGAASSLFVGW